ncbi:major facilitator superfamily domain-containing protein [Syncephalis plumigaleata]|nr:major facilitator superfamily domain-containing protein [Syncephalis plumigaleata]
MHRLAIIVFLGSLDQTVVSPAIPRIASDFGALNQISWIGVAYLLSSTATRPLYGRFSDIFGRKAVFLVATIIFLAGSFGCGIASNMFMFILMRAIAGIGGGGFITMTLIIISDIVPSHQRGQYAGIVGAVFAFSSVIGPLLGGLFTDHLSWRWAFYINLPVGAITILMIVFTLKLESPTGSVIEKLKSVDYLGTILILAFCVALLLPISWGGTTYNWSSPIIIGLFCAAVFFLILFLWVEHSVAKMPLIPLSIFKSHSVIAICIGCFFLGWGFFSPIYFLPLFFQTARNYTATKSGMALLPFVVPVSLMAIVSSTIASRVGKWCYRLFLSGGMLLTAIGFGLITLFDIRPNDTLEIVSMIILGIGFGSVMQTVSLAGQVSVTYANSAIITALTSFFQSIGGVVGLAVEGSLFTNRLVALLNDIDMDQLLSSDNPQSIEIIHQLDDPLKHQVLDAYTSALRTQYYILVPIVILAALAFLLVRPLSGDTNEWRMHPNKQKANDAAIV